LGRAHALAAGVLGVALCAALDPRLALPLAVVAVLLSLLTPRGMFPNRGTRLALAAGAIVIVARLALGGPDVVESLMGGVSPSGESAAASTASAGPTGDPKLSSQWTVESVVRRAGGKQSAILRRAGTERVYAQLPRYPELVPGDLVAVASRVKPLPMTPDPEEAGWVAYLSRIGVTGTLEAAAVEPEGRSDDPSAQLARARNAAGDILGAALPEPLAGLAAAILIGLRERVDPTLVGEFTASGLTHVVAISGWNIAIVGATCAALARSLARRQRSLLIGSVIVAYTLFAGASPSVMRAALMASVALLAREGGRRAGASRALAVAVVAMVVADPATVVDPGFQLSSIATAGLVAWATPLGERLDRAAPRLPGFIRESLAVSTSAQLATLPIILFDFGRLSLISPVANLVAAPLVPLVMPGAAAALPLGALVEAGLPALALAVPLGLVTLPLATLVGLVHAAASVPFASVELPPALAPVAAALAGGLVLLVVRATSGNDRPSLLSVPRASA